MNKDIESLVKKIKKRGWEVTKKRKHYIFRLGVQTVTCSCSPSDKRAIRNVRSQVEKAEKIERVGA